MNNDEGDSEEPYVIMIGASGEEEETMTTEDAREEWTEVKSIARQRCCRVGLSF